MCWRIIILFFFISSCSVTPPPLYKYKSHPVYEINPKPERILLLNTYNVAAKKYRENKGELFKHLIDSVLVTAASEIKARTLIETEAIAGFTSVTPGDSSIYSIMKEHNATHAIVVDSFNVFFDQRDVEVTKTESGKNREAFYDIVSEIDFSFYNSQSLFKKSLMVNRRHYDSRTVISGFLAAGPNVVSQKKDAWKFTKDNLMNYLDLFFER
ncbi:MAG: hypothetical protein JWN83_1004 [Chitinophagaceae bacterium]|nr:hypothetical protein [Chitinophagaceae bacterium]